MSALRCQTCPRTYAPVIPQTLTFAGETVAIHDGPPGDPGDHVVEQAARAAGWLVGEGPTQGGEHVRRVHCPGCIGRTGDGPLVERWDATCETCGETASDAEDYEDEPFTEADAKRWKDYHECEPDVRLITPDTVAAREAEHQRMVAAAQAFSARKAVEKFNQRTTEVAS